MVRTHLWGLFARPQAEWERIRQQRYSIGRVYLTHTLWLALIPPIAGFIGTTQVGWQLGVGDPVKLTVESALRIAVLYYIALLIVAFSVGWMVHWMGKTYGADQPLSQCVALASYTATPLLLSGVMTLYPMLWLNLVIGIPVLGYTVYLFYTGVPIMMEIPQERGFLFSSAMVAFGLVALVALLAVTAILWGMGFEPVIANY
ncbi:MAG: Yip1 family protein [Gammaproteobacteria bacterium]